MARLSRHSGRGAVTKHYLMPSANRLRRNGCAFRSRTDPAELVDPLSNHDSAQTTRLADLQVFKLSDELEPSTPLLTSFRRGRESAKWGFVQLPTAGSGMNSRIS
jgi:hypothetical protein